MWDKIKKDVYKSRLLSGVSGGGGGSSGLSQSESFLELFNDISA